MLLSTLFFAALAAASAVPYNPIGKRELTHREVILYGEDGRTQVMDRDHYHALHGNITALPPLRMSNTENTVTTYDNEHLKATKTLKERAVNINQIPEHAKRGCNWRLLVVAGLEEKFYNWDVPMSSVINATAPTNTVAVTSGYSISNAVTVTAETTITWVKDFISSSLSIAYTRTWTSTYTAGYTFVIPQYKYGVVVSNPMVKRYHGYVATGCSGAMTKSSEWTFDSYSSQSYGDLSWVTGIISLCVGDRHPVPNCIGNGFIE